MRLLNSEKTMWYLDHFRPTFLHFIFGLSHVTYSGYQGDQSWLWVCPHLVRLHGVASSMDSTISGIWTENLRLSVRAVYGLTTGVAYQFFKLWVYNGWIKIKTTVNYFFGTAVANLLRFILNRMDLALHTQSHGPRITYSIASISHYILNRINLALHTLP